jgi:hypothetical protein
MITPAMKICTNRGPYKLDAPASAWRVPAGIHSLALRACMHQFARSVLAGVIAVRGRRLRSIAISGGSAGLRLDLELMPRPEEADIEFQEKVDLTQDDRRGIGSRPGEGQSNRRKFPDGGRDDEDASLGGCQVPGQLHRCCLMLPERTQSQADIIRR